MLLLAQKFWMAVMRLPFFFWQAWASLAADRPAKLPRARIKGAESFILGVRKLRSVLLVSAACGAMSVTDGTLCYVTYLCHSILCRREQYEVDIRRNHFPVIYYFRNRIEV